MVVDASAIIAIMFEEAEAPDCMAALQTEALRLISAVNYVEAGTVMAGRIKDGDRHEAIADLDAFLSDFGIAVAPIDDNLARAAMRARLDYGKGFGTRGGLNFGDCFAYALAKRHSAPLLYVGDDFALTDVQSGLAR
ncbi:MULTISPECIES: type II toxin-antitoxin system VapC family toxin [Sinorhizobium]|jgi:ribonuclease VapC|uniref:type II toxin-antitoxin system VapC family toxin n=1 Tax=Sinorhizobium TaxID=28105 RepID=UPI00036796CE|nr:MULTISPECIES: type II toxin-antitoxin system VapC family toxin [Sinorhizobium]PND22076.1 PIN domain nuclease [Ensifer sp. MMN_5]PND29242.1 PIN domain nuclease [Sinorhizobium sp. M4_45]